MMIMRYPHLINALMKGILEINPLRYGPLALFRAVFVYQSIYTIHNTVIQYSMPNNNL